MALKIGRFHMNGRPPFFPVSDFVWIRIGSDRIESDRMGSNRATSFLKTLSWASVFFQSIAFVFLLVVVSLLSLLWEGRCCRRDYVGVGGVVGGVSAVVLFMSVRHEGDDGISPAVC